MLSIILQIILIIIYVAIRLTEKQVSSVLKRVSEKISEYWGFPVTFGLKSISTVNEPRDLLDDMAVTNWKTSVLERYTLDWESITAR